MITYLQECLNMVSFANFVVSAIQDKDSLKQFIVYFLKKLFYIIKKDSKFLKINKGSNKKPLSYNLKNCCLNSSFSKTTWRKKVSECASHTYVPPCRLLSLQLKFSELYPRIVSYS